MSCDESVVIKDSEGPTLSLTHFIVYGVSCMELDIVMFLLQCLLYFSETPVNVMEKCLQ